MRPKSQIVLSHLSALRLPWWPRVSFFAPAYTVGMNRSLQVVLTCIVAAAGLAASVPASAASEMPGAAFESTLGAMLERASSPAARKALVEAVLLGRRHRLADQIRELESAIAPIRAERQVAINETKKEFMDCDLALGDEQVLDYARDIGAVAMDYIGQNPAWKKIIEPCFKWRFFTGFFDEIIAGKLMARVVGAQTRMDRKAATLESLRIEAAIVEAEILELNKAR